MVQLEEAKRYVASEGWSLRPEDVFVDDAVSRAEFKKRWALLRLLNQAKNGAFDVVVTRDETRLGGDMLRTGLVIEELRDAGVRLVYYYSDEEVETDGATKRFLVMARNFASELEREKISQRTYEHLAVKARKGLVVGGRVYGYDNIRGEDGAVVYRINEEQAEVVRLVFQRYVDGAGLRTIATELNDRGVPSPRAGKRGTGSWSPGCIREMLCRERYRGTIVWNRYEKQYRGGTKIRVPRPENEWIRIDVPDLRIVDDEHWFRVRDRFGSRSRVASPGPGRKPKYLLSKIARCGVCGGPLKVSNGKDGQRNIKVYCCAWHRDRGNSVCANSMRRPMEVVDEAVVSWIREHVLTERRVVLALKEIRRRLRERTMSSGQELPGLEEDAKQVKREIDRLTVALASTEAKPEAVVRAIAEREERLRKLQARIEVLRAAPSVLDLEVRRMEMEARQRLKELTGLLDRNSVEARRAVEAILKGPLTVTPIKTPEGNRYEITGETTFGRLFTNVASPAGFEPALPA